MNWLAIFLKGAAMGAANVIPGVSGGTVAFITGIYERLIHAIKSLTGPALKLLLKGDFRGFLEKSDFAFLVALGLGVLVSILSLAKALDYLFAKYEMYVWAFFFGLIIASVIFVGNKVKRWGVGPIIALIIGTLIAVGIALLKPASENEALAYLLVCGVVAMASMIIPGLSGSFVLILMGNYHLIMIESVVKLTDRDPSALRILVPVGIGAVVGMLAFSHLLSWIFKRFHDIAVALLTGFVAGSLLIIWPWKDKIVEIFGEGVDAKEQVVSYDWNLPTFDMSTLVALGLIVAGFVIVWIMEKSGMVEESME